MKHQKILNLLNEASNFKSLTRKQNIFNDQSNANCDVGNKIIYNTVEILKSNLCNYNSAHILVRRNITIVGDNGAEVAFKKYAPKIKISQKLIEQQ